jgi:hypothetical protein
MRLALARRQLSACFFAMVIGYALVDVLPRYWSASPTVATAIAELDALDRIKAQYAEKRQAAREPTEQAAVYEEIAAALAEFGAKLSHPVAVKVCRKNIASAQEIAELLRQEVKATEPEEKQRLRAKAFEAALRFRKEVDALVAPIVEAEKKLTP